MLLTFKDAKEKLAKDVEEGRCSTDPEVGVAINEAQDLLLAEGDWKNTIKRYRTCVKNRCFAAPEWVETILKDNFGAHSAGLYNQAYEFLDSGPGTLDISVLNQCSKNLVDLGSGFAIQFPIGCERKKVVAISDRESDVDKTMFIRGTGEFRNEVRTDDTIGETIKITAWDRMEEEGNPTEGLLNANNALENQSENQYADIYYVEKPRTNGYITLAVYDFDTDQYSFLAKYSPDSTKPEFRRYFITGTDLTNVETITALVKVKHVELVNDSDILLIQSIPALRAMLRAINEFNRGSTNQAIIEQQTAIRILDRQLSNNVRATNMMDVQFEGFGIGSDPNLDW